MFRATLLILAVTLTPVTNPDTFSNLLEPGTKCEKVAGGFEFVEGPAWSPRGYLLFSDIPDSRIVMLSVSIMAVSMALFTQVQADWTATTEIAVILVLGFGFGLGMPALTDAIMASVPVEDAGVGSAVNDVSRELGSALGVAVLGSVINGIYRSNVHDELTGVVPDETVELAQEGIGVVAASAPSLAPDIADTTFAASSTAFRVGNNASL